MHLIDSITSPRPMFPGQSTNRVRFAVVCTDGNIITPTICGDRDSELVECGYGLSKRERKAIFDTKDEALLMMGRFIESHPNASYEVWEVRTVAN